MIGTLLQIYVAWRYGGVELRLTPAYLQRE